MTHKALTKVNIPWLLIDLHEDNEEERNDEEESDEEEDAGGDAAAEADRDVAELDEDTRKVQCGSAENNALQDEDQLLKQELELERRRRKELSEDISEELQLRRILMQQQW